LFAAWVSSFLLCFLCRVKYHCFLKRRVTVCQPQHYFIWHHRFFNLYSATLPLFARLGIVLPAAWGCRLFMYGLLGHIGHRISKSAYKTRQACSGRFGCGAGFLRHFAVATHILITQPRGYRPITPSKKENPQPRCGFSSRGVFWCEEESCTEFRLRLPSFCDSYYTGQLRRFYETLVNKK
jgi:hypothetical protein